MQLEEEVTQLLQRLEQSATDMDELKLENQALQGRLEIRDSTVKELETRLNVAEAELETCHHQLDSTRHELSLAQQSMTHSPSNWLNVKQRSLVTLNIKKS